jgi:hypothetical protein
MSLELSNLPRIIGYTVLVKTMVVNRVIKGKIMKKRQGRSTTVPWEKYFWPVKKRK